MLMTSKCEKRESEVKARGDTAIEPENNESRRDFDDVQVGTREGGGPRIYKARRSAIGRAWRHNRTSAFCQLLSISTHHTERPCTSLSLSLIAKNFPNDEFDLTSLPEFQSFVIKNWTFLSPLSSERAIRNIKEG